mgnify:CR=1 FL=1
MQLMEFLSWLWAERLWMVLLAALVVLLIFALFLNLHNASNTSGDDDSAGPPRRE